MNDEHGHLRTQLGAFALGHLDDHESAAVLAHLDGCASCRDELATIAPLTARLDLVDVAHLDQRAVTPAELGARIVADVRREREAADERARAGSGARIAGTHAWGLVAAATVAVLIGFGAAWALKPGDPQPPREAVTVEVVESGVVEASADLVAHTWGMEIKLQGSGFREGTSYVVDVVDADGTLSTAGAFIGVGDATMDCNLNSSVLREDATGFAVRDENGTVVLTSTF